MSSNRLKATLAGGGTALGLSCALGSAQVAEDFAMAGFDYIYIDQQHGLTSQDTLVGMLRAIARSMTTPLVRVLRNDAGLIGQALDAGAEGVIVPMVETAADAVIAASATRYAPIGTRSWGPLRATHGLGADPATVNGQVLCLVMIESATAVANLDEILAVPGIDGVYVGPADLSVSLGGAPVSMAEATDRALLDAVAAIQLACAAAGKIAAISGDPVALAAQGFTMITTGMDAAMMRAALKSKQLERPAR